MKDNQAPKAIYLKDYKKPDFLIDDVDLLFQLYEEYTIVKSKLSVRKNPDVEGETRTLKLNGGDIELVQIKIDGKILSDENYHLESEYLIIENVETQFLLEVETTIQPQLNTRLEGLYKSNGMFCTQCEAEGFRHITYFLDRPDIMSRFSTRIEADESQYPVLLSNGNPVGSGKLGNGRHWVAWDDPFKKPCYLFALVAGDLALASDSFTTLSGRTVEIRLYVEPQDLDKCAHAIDSLKNSMGWDEEVFGREYDLDIYMIVAVSHFNMGAMENKGLNIFNTSCVLANPKTTTDAGFQRVEGVVAHEYFHNWSGNRVTCRDWFQLSLKEGFTVFRDEEFSSDMGSRTVKRIEDVTFLRTHQFAEDAGPMAHSVRPDSYIEMNNFYTATVYHKGSEVVRMIHTLVGAEGFRKGCDLYFQRYDGQAVTCDEFVGSMEEANGIDLGQFRNWYSQAGTPVLNISDEYDAEGKKYKLTVAQECPATPGQDHKEPFYIPLKMGLLDRQGAAVSLELEESVPNVLKNDRYDFVIPITESVQEFTFNNVAEKPLPSLLRGFSAPVNLNFQYSKDELAFLMRHDSDDFNRWDAAQKLALICIKELLQRLQQQQPLELDETLKTSFKYVLEDQALDKAVAARILMLPSEAYIVEQTEQSDPDGIFQVRQFIKTALAEELADLFHARYEENESFQQYRPVAEDIAKRCLKNLCLDYLSLQNSFDVEAMCYQQYEGANNMTDESAAFRIIVHRQMASWQQLVDNFYDKWKHEPLVVDLWLSTQATSPAVDTLQHVQKLSSHEAFEHTNPNKVRALIGAFCNANLVNFHHESGDGYQYLADTVIQMNKINPQIAARLITPLTRWSSYNPERQVLMCSALEKISAQPDLSPDVYEVVSKSLVKE